MNYTPIYTYMNYVSIKNRMLVVSESKNININQIRSIERLATGKCKVVISSRQEYIFNVSYDEMMTALESARSGNKDVYIAHTVTQKESKEKYTNKVVGYVGLGVFALIVLITLGIVGC